MRSWESVRPPRIGRTGDPRKQPTAKRSTSASVPPREMVGARESNHAPHATPTLSHESLKSFEIQWGGLDARRALVPGQGSLSALLVARPDRVGGEPVFKRTRVPVRHTGPADRKACALTETTADSCANANIRPRISSSRQPHMRPMLGMDAHVVAARRASGKMLVDREPDLPARPRVSGTRGRPGSGRSSTKRRAHAMSLSSNAAQSARISATGATFCARQRARPRIRRVAREQLQRAEQRARLAALEQPSPCDRRTFIHRVIPVWGIDQFDLRDLPTRPRRCQDWSGGRIPTGCFQRRTSWSAPPLLAATLCSQRSRPTT